jgi:hypothetical protein
MISYLEDISVTSSGSGNAITSISYSNGVITANKGSTFLTSHQDISGKADKSHTHDDRYYTKTEINTKLSSDVTSNNLINALGTGDSVPIDGDYFISQYAGGSTLPDTNTSKNNFYRRPISTLWSYIKSKIEATRLSHSKGITISNTTDVTLSSFGSEGLSIGTSAGTNIGIDNNEIQARNNGAASPLYINGNGGAVYFGAGDKYYISSDGSSYNGTASKATADGSGNNIVNTYATKTELAGKAPISHTHGEYVSKNASNTMAANSGLDFNTNRATLRIPVFGASDAVPASNGAIFIQKVD